MTARKKAEKMTESDPRIRSKISRPAVLADSSDATAEVAAGPLTTPQASAHAFAAAIGDGDLETASNCLAPEVTLITPDATAVTGRGAVRDVLAQLIANPSTIEFDPAGVIEAGDVAFVQQRWRIRFDAIAGPSYLQGLTPNFVLLRLGTQWCLAILAPWGCAGSSIG
jgi:ketosteroid isomerase-like protein